VNALLRDSQLLRVLADEDPLRFAARALEHRSRHQAVVEDHVGLLEQLQCTQGQQVRVAGTGADQVDLARGGVPGCAERGELALERLRGARLVALEHARTDRATEQLLPEAPPLRAWQRVLNGAATAAGKAREDTEPRRQQRLELLAQASGQHRRRPFSTDRNDDG